MNLNSVFRLAGSFCLTITLLYACSTTKNIQQATINGKNVAFVVEGKGTPTLVFETGMGPSIDTWDKILDSLSKHTRVYAYNRPGYGNSQLKDLPKNITEVAKQLHANLLSQDIEPPYILIGHSLGGLYINMFARLYPEETAGVVFIDASHPEQFEYFKNEQELLYNLIITAAQKGKRTYEYDIVTTASNNFLDAPNFPEVPISVLTAGKSSALENKELRVKWLEFQKELSKLSSNTEHQIVEESGHYIHRNAPEKTIAEILRILELSQNN